MKFTKPLTIFAGTASSILATAMPLLAQDQDKKPEEDPQMAPYAGVPGWAETKSERIQWFKDAKFGMFIHWGLYSGAGGHWPPETGKQYEQHYAEWIKAWAEVPEPEYGNLTKPRFKPEEGCTEAWAKLAKQMGAKYAVLTTKHHEGYTLFNSKSPYSLDNEITGGTNISPEGRDLVAEYSDSLRAEGLGVGYYYSLIDWQHPGGSAVDYTGQDYIKHLNQHIDELASNYGKVDILWVDYSQPAYQGATWNTAKVLTNLLEKQPEVIINNRFWNDISNAKSDFFTPEKYVPPTGFPGRAFEVCHTMNESFGYSYHDTKWKSTTEVVHLLMDIVSKGGNLLMNVGPDRFGNVPEECVKSLQGVGQWLDVYGEAVYGTEANPFSQLTFNGVCTQKKIDDETSALYLHVFEWPSGGEIVLNGLSNEVLSATVLAEEGALSHTKKDGQISISVPKEAPNEICSVIKVVLKGAPEVEKIRLSTQRPDRSIEFDVLFSELEGSNIKLMDPKMHVEKAYIGNWKTTEDQVSLPYMVSSPGAAQAGGVVQQNPGRYAVILDHAIAADSGGTVKITTADDQMIEVELESTGDWNTYQKKKVGEITLTEKGKDALLIQAAKIKGEGLMNLRGITFQPLD